MTRSSGKSLHTNALQLLQNSPVVTYTCRAYGDYGATFITDNITQQLGYQPDQFTADPLFWLDNIHPDDKAQVVTELEHLYENGHHTHEYRFRSSNGDYRWMRDTLNLEYDDEGKPKQITGYWIDITEQVDAQQHTSQQINAFSAILENVTDSIITISDTGSIEFFNTSAERLFGYQANEVIGKNINILMPAPHRDKHDYYLKDYHATGKKKVIGNGPREVEARHKDGSIIAVDLMICEATIDGKHTFIGIISDITERKAAEENISRSKYNDLLTGLANRTLFNDQLQHVINLAKINKTKVAILYIDLDQFKMVNDTLGHHAGDLLLQEAAQRLLTHFEKTQTVARLGGDEFAVILNNINDKKDAITIAQNLIRAFDPPFMINNNEIFSGISIGISIYPDDANDAISILKNADISMYKAKETGRSHWVLYSSGMSDHIRKRQELETPLRRALENDQFVLHFQPQVDLRSGKMMGAEALIRWNHPEKGLIPPLDFIPILEETGMIDAVSEWVIQTACKQNKQWQDAGLPEIVVAVNLCAYNLKNISMASTIDSILQTSGLAPKYLDIELTEGSIISDTEETLKILHEMKEIGVNLSIDDFGTGYSSLSYLKRLPLDILKIDRSFITDITSNSDSAAIAQSIMALAHSMRMKVTAEGIETKAQLDYLTKSQCNFMQGYYFSKPVSHEEFTLLLQEDRHLDIPEPLDQSTRTILLLDDEVNITSTLKRLLRRHNYNILTANTAHDAYELLASNHVGVVLCDQRMPDISGTEFLGVVKNLYPHTVRMILSGYADLKSITDAINAGSVFKFMIKPWDDEPLLRNIEEAFDYYKLTRSANIAKK